MIGAIVSYHNQSDTIDGCIKSIEKQCETLDCRVIVYVIDDASAPKLSLSKSLYSLPVACVRASHNVGVQRVRNFGFHLMKKHSPEYVIFVDGDVEFADGAFSKMKAAIETGGDGVAYAYGHFSRRGALTGRQVSAPFSAERLRRYNYISTMSLIKYNILAKTYPRPFVEDEDRFQDWSLWLRLLNRGYTGAFVNSVLFSAYFSGDGISTNSVVDYQEWRRIVHERYNQTQKGVC